MAYADLKNAFVFRRVFGQHADVLRGLLNDSLGREGDARRARGAERRPDELPSILPLRRARRA